MNPQIKYPLVVLMVMAVVLTAQISCVRPGPATESTPTASPTPTEQAIVDQILQHYEAALGGKEAIANITTYKLKGTFELAGMTGTIESWRKEPLKTLTVIEFPRIGTLKKGFDGENRWVQTPAGTFRDSSPQEIAELERDSEVYSVGRIKSLFESMKLENKARLNGRDVYVIEGKPPKGPAEKLLFDVENGLLVRWDMARRQPNRGTVFVKVHLDDYKDIDGVKIPFNVRFAFESFTFIVKLQSIEHNIPIDDAVFRKP
jgi:zinc protease